VVVVSAVLGCRLPEVRAEPAARDAAFRGYVTKRAQGDKLWIDSWWAANLDTDPGVERVAILCADEVSGEERHAYVIFEKDATHRWELTIDVDKHTRACVKKPEHDPTWEERKLGRVEIYQGHNVGFEITAYALRQGRIVIVREEENDGTGTKVNDWDQIVKKKKGQPYQIPDRVRELTD
jgi:hypothetical protein